MVDLHGISFFEKQAPPSDLFHDHMERFAPPPRTVLATRIDEHSRDPFRWLIVDDTYPEQIAERLRLLRTQGDYLIDRLPTQGVRASEIELRDHVVNYLTENYPAWFRREGDIVHAPLTGLSVDVGPDGADPLVAIALLASEDLEIMLPTHRDDSNPDPQKRGEVFTFQSGALLFPNGWSLRSHFNAQALSGETPETINAWRAASEDHARLGKSLSEIHNPVVQEYMKRFTGGDAFFQRMQAGQLAWRRNWSPKIGNRMCLHPDLPDNGSEFERTEKNWTAHGVVRSEHETFFKLPKTGGVVFGIKTYVWPLREMAASPAVRNALIAAYDNLSPEMRDYRRESLPSFGAWLDQFRSAPAAEKAPAAPAGKCPFRHNAG